jgi:hypothetical protein
MNEKLLKAVVELMEATYERDCISGDGSGEERVFAALDPVLDEILADPDLSRLHSWVRELRAKSEAADKAMQAEWEAAFPELV